MSAQAPGGAKADRGGYDERNVAVLLGGFAPASGGYQLQKWTDGA